MERFKTWVSGVSAGAMALAITVGGWHPELFGWHVWLVIALTVAINLREVNFQTATNGSKFTTANFVLLKR